MAGQLAQLEQQRQNWRRSATHRYGLRGCEVPRAGDPHKALDLQGCEEIPEFSILLATTERE